MELRKVMFKKWIAREYDADSKTTKTGTNCWEPEFKNSGLFHKWGNAYEESIEGFGNYTVAIVELSDGTITEVFPSNIKFIN